MACGSTTSRHAADPPATPTQTHTVIEYRKDGAISKMRSHKGNVPVLPQTKLCPHCPAKFTRTTHLNRHLRTHTGERSHCCDTCEAQFTRSDLLTRHKKTCGDPSHANRTRRRSCQACADSKVKCDLQRPCSKCQARGKECTFAVRSSRSFVGTVPSVSATLVDRGPDTVRVATAPPTLVPTTPNSTPNTPPKPNIPPDQLDQASFDWTSSLIVSNGLAGRQGALRPLPGGLSPSPSDTYSSASDAGPSVTSGSVLSHSPLPPLYSSDFGSFFPPFSEYDNATVGSDNTHAPHDDSPVPAAMSSSITSADDTLSFATQGMGAQYQFQSTESVYYVQSSSQQQQIVPQMQRQRYAQDPYAPPFSEPINNIRQHNSSELQHYLSRRF
ncbi:hypothetical protein PAXRUDRAFT_668207 [Paxillus rubicundulus Ve08.2h10]|uniref:Uncharacterized protein n=1 Tax=Paxillus rubicundulus Ve08.2h10 TaxID=930991 RepID=A0A0D0E366_9AGAM|nr:hypothetical protein PAXRUDRAFT_668207 [Paxillus rubicundulus Ve08.2h10]